MQPLSAEAKQHCAPNSHQETIVFNHGSGAQEGDRRDEGETCCSRRQDHGDGGEEKVNELEVEVAKDLVDTAKNLINLNIIDQTRDWYVGKGDFWAPYYELIWIDSTKVPIL